MALGCLLKGCCSCISNPKSQTVLYKYLVPLIVSVIHSGRSFSLWIFQTMGVVCESDHEIKLHILTLDPSWWRITGPPKFRTKCSPQKSPQQDERTWFVHFLFGAFSLQPSATCSPSTSPAQRWRWAFAWCVKYGNCITMWSFSTSIVWYRFSFNIYYIYILYIYIIYIMQMCKWSCSMPN